jgi:hypothetical protein
LYDGKAGNGLKVLRVESDDAEAEMQGRGADDQIRKINSDAPPYLVTVNAPGQSRYLQREWMYGHGPIEFLAKGLAALAVCDALGTIDAVRQFHDCHSGKG